MAPGDLRALREAFGLSRGALAALVSQVQPTHINTIAQWELGLRSMKNAQALCFVACSMLGADYPYSEDT